MLDFFSILSKGGLVLWYFQAGFKNMQDTSESIFIYEYIEFFISKIGLRAVTYG